MCGIAFIFHRNGITPQRQCIERMTRTLNHRGPDAQAVVLRGEAALGHTRLSIVDVAGGAQPMLSADQRHAIVFNGEIYNYRELRSALEANGVRFAGLSDTEVILHLYRRDGAACVQKLRGMFSFAVHDAVEHSLFIARDHLGIKPLFYHWSDKQLVAASEIKALFASGLVEPRFNPAAIRGYFTYQFAVSPHTPFDGVRELPPGCRIMALPGQAPKIERYWDLNFPREHEYESHDEQFWTREFRGALEGAAASHTIGEVPIGAYLSGGIDSSTLTWLLGESYGKPVQTFSVHFAGNALDEAPVYRAIAGHLKVGNTEVSMDDNKAEGYVRELATAIYHLEQPQRMALDVPYFLLSRLARDNNYKVVYTGDGADEILGGYDCYRQDYMRLWGNDIRDPALRKLLYFSQYTQNFSEPFMQMMFAQHAPERQRQVIDRYGCYPAWHDFWQITADQLPGLFNRNFEQTATATDPMGELASAMKPQVEGRHRVNQSLYLETKTRLPGWILWRGDRMSMAHGVEARVPFLDHPLVELTARIPPDLKLHGMDEKYLLKKIALPHLPPHPWQFKKKAFYTPIREWFFTPAQHALLDPYLSKQALHDAGIFDPGHVLALRARIEQAQAPGDMNSYYALMKLEWIMMLVLTVQMLHVQFIAKRGACFDGI